MTSKSFFLDDALHGHLVAHSSPLGEQHEALIARTAELGGVARMQTAPEQVVLLGLLTKLVGTVQAVEVGTFTGASALAIAGALSPGGRLLCCDGSEEWTTIAREAWARAGVDDRIELRIAPALDTLRALPAEATVDLAYIDADKGGYRSYYDELVPRLRPGGLLLADNTLWGGAVLDAEDTSDDTVAIRAFNDHVAGDPRVEVVLLAIGDGLTVCRRVD